MFIYYFISGTELLRRRTLWSVDGKCWLTLPPRVCTGFRRIL